MRTIIVNGRRWFQRGPGNTYHSVEVIDGEFRAVIPYTYGHGDQYLETAYEILIEVGRLPPAERHKSGGKESLVAHCRAHGITLHYSVCDVARRRDLHSTSK